MAKQKKPNHYARTSKMISVTLYDRGWNRRSELKIEEGTTAENFFLEHHPNQGYMEWQPNMAGDHILQSGETLEIEFDVVKYSPFSPKNQNN